MKTFQEWLTATKGEKLPSGFHDVDEKPEDLDDEKTQDERAKKLRKLKKKKIAAK